MPFKKGNKINVGRKFSEEHKKRISESAIEWYMYHNNYKRGLQKGHKIGLGRKRTTESRLKMSVSMKKAWENHKYDEYCKCVRCRQI